MKKKILYLANECKIHNKLTLFDVGDNYGNLCFYHGTINIFKNHDIYFNNSNRIKDPDLVIISVANAICNIDYMINYLVYLTDILSQYKC